MSIEEPAKKLIFLAGKPALSKNELAEAKKLMVELKKSGMSNSDISKLTGGRWSVPTIKGYTTGVTPESPSLWKDAVSMLNSVISENISLGQVETSLNLIEDLKNYGLHLEDLVDFIGEVNTASVDLASVVQWVAALKESGLSLDYIKGVVELKKDIEAKGLGLDALPLLVKLAKNYGDAGQVLKAVSAYGTINELSAEIQAAEGKLKSLGVQIDSAEGKLKETQAKNADLAAPLKAYQATVQLGFGEKELNDLAGLAGKFGGPKAVLSALKAYTDEAEINAKVAKSKIELSNLQLKLNDLTAKYNHLITAITMCQSLINDYKLGPDAIATIFSLAKKYGEPMNVLRAIETFGNLQAVQQKLATLTGQISEGNESLAELKGKCKAALDQLESLNATALKVGKEVSDVEHQLADSKIFQKLLTLMNSPDSADYKDYGPLVASTANSIRKFVANNENKFRPMSAVSIRLGLDSLISELGGG